MKIGILGYGSLIWSPRNLAVKGDWNNEGIHLPVEFSRIAANGRVVLTLTPEAELQKTLWIKSKFSDLIDAIDNLASREGCHASGIGIIDKNNVATKDFLGKNNLDCLIYANLERNFESVTGKNLCHESVRHYLSRLDENTYAIAREYIENAPPQINTLIRRSLIW